MQPQPAGGYSRLESLEASRHAAFGAFKGAQMRLHSQHHVWIKKYFSMKNSMSRGFTLLEMSIVLVIIGTIIAAIMLGRNLLVTSKLQQVITDVDSYTTAVGDGEMLTACRLWFSK